MIFGKQSSFWNLNLYVFFLAAMIWIQFWLHWYFILSFLNEKFRMKHFFEVLSRIFKKHKKGQSFDAKKKRFLCPYNYIGWFSIGPPYYNGFRLGNSPSYKRQSASASWSLQWQTHGGRLPPLQMLFRSSILNNCLPPANVDHVLAFLLRSFQNVL